MCSVWAHSSEQALEVYPVLLKTVKTTTGSGTISTFQTILPASAPLAEHNWRKGWSEPGDQLSLEEKVNECWLSKTQITGQRAAADSCLSGSVSTLEGRREK